MPHLLDLSHGRRFELGASETIGRDPSCSIALTDSKVSVRHAELRGLAAGRYLVVDLNSRNGTFVNGERVLTAFLADGDRLTVGSTRLRLEASEEAVGGIEPLQEGLTDQLTAQVMQRLQVEAEPRFRPASELEEPDELRRGYEKLRVAYELLRATSAEDDIDRLLERILATSFKLLEADRVTVLLIDQATGETSRRLSRRRDGAPEAVQIPQSILREVVGQRASVLTADAAADNRFSRARSIVIEGIRSAMCVPMLAGEDLFGVMHLDSLLATNVFTQEDLELFTSIACQAAMVVKHVSLRARLTEEARAREGAEREMQIARRIQTALLPVVTALPGYSVAGAMVPAEVVGGDYYDVLEFPRRPPDGLGRFWIAMGDVSSHGVTPGLIMMMAQSIVFALTSRDPGASPSQVYAELNRVLFQNVRVRLGEENYMTLVLLRSDGGGRFTFAGKHLDLVVRRAKTGEVSFVPTAGTWLGVLDEDCELTRDASIELSPGDLLLLHTDGVTEARDREGKMFEQEGLVRVLEAAPGGAAEVCAALVGAARRHAEVQDDDVTVLVLRREP